MYSSLGARWEINRKVHGKVKRTRRMVNVQARESGAEIYKFRVYFGLFEPPPHEMLDSTSGYGQTVRLAGFGVSHRLLTSMHSFIYYYNGDLLQDGRTLAQKQKWDYYHITKS